ncbi:urea ABC transporter ATP-binding subunit UrtE [Microvirga aerophila]|uniref:ABC transporter ATP-binding protein n=1 Tax=Microvirga aerophila TaxID=670291 RepID=A0A512BYE4_9HYPH|nr:urea ABC transporter ATP-binding subunit UrtE [Microvirga aerophila]GEO16981.1 ABC transporter ATP-binding protein [Microvirga aerophila]
MLSVRNLSAGYDSVPVLDNITLDVRAGEIVVILGRNGVGKSTLMRTLAGALPPSSGSVVFQETEIAGWRPNQIARQGLAYVPQGRGIFPKLTVQENLLLGTRARRDRSGTIPDAIYTHFPILRERAFQDGGTLSGGQQQQLAIGRAMCGDPRLLLLDEPSEGIQPNIVWQIGQFLTTIARESQISVVLVEQNLDLALNVGDRCLVMEKGRIVHSGTPDEFRNEEVLRKFLAI